MGWGTGATVALKCGERMKSLMVANTVFMARNDTRKLIILVNMKV
jgi:hypothetical protein